jgi:hypothetical protein
MSELVFKFQPCNSPVGNFPTHVKDCVGYGETSRTHFDLGNTGIGSEINGRILREQSSREHERNKQ